MSKSDEKSANRVVVTSAMAATRLDLFLLSQLKISKSQINRAIKNGDIRVNGKRVSIFQKLKIGDEIRIPPMKVFDLYESKILEMPFPILFEDEYLLAIDKPAGISVQEPKSIRSPIVDKIQAAKKYPFLSLVHRIDKDTSGILLLGKSQKVLDNMEKIFRDKKVEKKYLALSFGQWKYGKKYLISAPLKKTNEGTGKLAEISNDGLEAKTFVSSVREFGDLVLLEAEPVTGRMHQIRAHLAYVHFPIIGDSKYGDFNKNKKFQEMGLKRMFLHASEILFPHPVLGKMIKIASPLAKDLEEFIHEYEKKTCS